MAAGAGDGRDETDRPTPGEEAAAREQAFWETRRRAQDLDDDEAGRRERRRLSKRSRRMNLDVRVHRYARRVDEGPVPGDLRLPPLPDREDPAAEFPEDFRDDVPDDFPADFPADPGGAESDGDDR
ncbi:hypothetical protein ACFO3J_08145 [Streptomyces polygonati]|uniref:Uncharacterized protein n=1 Tax=Streptomyces polygonati TaxID=1617087 RepID=A0ABV8HH87_9ACTN